MVRGRWPWCRRCERPVDEVVRIQGFGIPDKLGVMCHGESATVELTPRLLDRLDGELLVFEPRAATRPPVALTSRRRIALDVEE